MAKDRRLRIGIDAHAIGARKTGNERFIANILRELRELCDHEFVLFFTDAAAASEWGKDGWDVRLMRPKHPALRIPLTLPHTARRENLDVLLVQYTAPRWLGCPVVTVVHDVSFAEHPEFFSPIERLWMPRTIPATMRRAAKVVTVSEFSKREIRRIYDIPERKIAVAPDGVDPAFATEAPSGEDMPYFLFVGNLEPRKNLSTLLEAYRSLGDLPERLLVVGQGPRPSGGDGVHFLGYVPDSRLPGLMQDAAALCYPSLYEGFGLPVIEAMAAGTPVLASDIPAIREVADDAAVLLPATDAGAWSEAMSKISSDPSFARSLADRGRARAAHFTWERTARVVLQALEEAAL